MKLIPNRILIFGTTMKAFENIQKEENPEWVEFDEEEKTNKIQQLDKLKQIREKYDVEKDTNCYQLVELNADLPSKTVLK